MKFLYFCKSSEIMTMGKKDIHKEAYLNSENGGITYAEQHKAVLLIKAAILQSQSRAAQMVNQEQLSLYYGIGRYVSEHSRQGFWELELSTALVDN